MAAKAVRTKPDPMVALIACGMGDTVASINHAAAVTAATVDLCMPSSRSCTCQQTCTESRGVE